MSQEDRQKWDKRYRDGAYADRNWPSRLLEEQLSGIAIDPAGYALDIACGAGRNSRYLAKQGFRVDAIDISREALGRAEAESRQFGLEINWICADLESRDAAAVLPPGPYRVIAMVRYVNAPLIPKLAERLAPGGCLVIEEHLATDEDVIGPKNPAFRMSPGELTSTVRENGLKIAFEYEGLVEDPDGRIAALSQVIARRGPVIDG